MVNKMKFLAAGALSGLGSFAALAEDTVTGIDWTADIITPAEGAGKAAIEAGVVIFALILAVGVGKRLIAKVSGR